MPIYEYTCRNCDAKFEELVRSINASEAKVKCPQCGSPKTARALSVFAVGAESASSRSSSDAPSCGRCGGAPGSCQM